MDVPAGGGGQVLHREPHRPDPRSAPTPRSVLARSGPSRLAPVSDGECLGRRADGRGPGREAGAVGSAAMSNEARTRLVVLFGGVSAERDVSCVSAAHVLAAIDAERFDVVPVGIDPEGRWLLADEAKALLDSGRTGEIGGSVEVVGTELEPLPAVAPRSRASRSWSCPSSTDRWARTAPCRGCWSWPACPTSAPACSGRRRAWTRWRPRPWPRRPGCPRSATWPPATSRSTPPSGPMRWRRSGCRCS